MGTLPAFLEEASGEPLGADGKVPPFGGISSGLPEDAAVEDTKRPKTAAEDHNCYVL